MSRNAIVPIVVLAIFGSLTAIALQPGVRHMGKQPNGSYLVSTNQTLTPCGVVNLTAGARPKDLAVSPDGSQFAVHSTNRLWIYKANGDPVDNVSITGSALGVVWNPAGDTIYVSESGGRVRPITLTDGKWRAQEMFNVDVPAQGNARAAGNSSQAAGLAISTDGKKLYVALGMRNAIAIVALPEGKVEAAIPAGVAPYNLAMTPDGSKLVAANLAGDIEQNDVPEAQLSAKTRVAVDPQTDANAFGSLTIIDTKTLSARHLQVGRQPRGMAISKNGARCYVTNSNDDTVSTVDLAEGRVLNTFSVRPAQDVGYGQIPVACTLSEDEKRLFVTCGGGNSVAVVDLAGAPKIAGYLPTGWFPLAIARVGSGLAVASSKGIGARPENPARGFGVHASVGMVQVIPQAEIEKIAAHTKQVALNNSWSSATDAARKDRRPVPIPERVGEPSVFKYVVYIIKENHTYDLDFGDMKEGNGDPKLCLFPEEVTPNGHALAREFILLDNTYTSGTNSADGHQWVASSIANGYMEQNYNAHERSYPYDGGDPLSTSPTGYLWTQAAKAGKSVRVYGEFVDKPQGIDPATGKAPTWKQLWDDYKSGANKMQITAGTSQAALRPHMHPTFIGFPSIVSDQWRADQYIAELKEFEAKGSMPNLSIMLLPNDHTSGTRAGMPTPRAAVADNDLAVGRIVDAISKSQFWKETLILVVEDDSQLAFDHIDGHRQPVQVISAYTRRKNVNHEPYNHTSFARTIGLVLGLPPMNRFDRSGQPLTACFTPKADTTPFTFRPAKIALDEMNPNPRALNGEAKRWAEASNKLNLSDVDRVNPNIVGRAVWHSMRGSAPFPASSFNPPDEPDGDDDDD